MMASLSEVTVPLIKLCTSVVEYNLPWLPQQGSVY